MLVVTDKQRRIDIVHDLHQELGSSVKAVAMSSHLGRTSAYRKVSSPFYWYAIVNDVADYIKCCDKKKLKKNWRILLFSQRWWNKLGLIFAAYQVWMHLRIVCIDYFSKWSEAKPIHDKSTSIVAQFLYELICRHHCFAVQINDQGKEFANEVADELHSMAGTQQTVKSAYLPQSNGLVELQNRTIKSALIKVLDPNFNQWP